MSVSFKVMIILFCGMSSGCIKNNPKPLFADSHEPKIPEYISGNWVCSTESTGKSNKLTLDTQDRFETNGRFIFSGSTHYRKNDEEVLLAIIGEGDMQMIDGKYWLKMNDAMMLPTVGNINGTVVSIIKNSLTREFPVYEIGTYSLDGNFLTLRTDPEGLVKTCLDWESWDAIENNCLVGDEADCFTPIDDSTYAQEKLLYKEKRRIFQ